LKRDVLLFAASIGATNDELHFLYVCIFPNCPVPLYIIEIHRSLVQQLEAIMGSFLKIRATH
jgi:hypothetical protein